MGYDSWRSLPAMFLEQADRLASRPFLWAKRDGRYRPLSWAEAARDVRKLAFGLRSLGIGRGERVALVSENRPEWIIADLAIMSAGAITVPAYVTNTIEDHRHILANSGARAVIVSKPALSARVLAAANQVDTVNTVIAIEPTSIETPDDAPTGAAGTTATASRASEPMATARRPPRTNDVLIAPPPGN